LKDLPHNTHLSITPEEKLPPRSNSGWTTWRCLIRLHTGIARTKTELKKWGFVIPTANTTCQCEADEDTVQHRLKCTLLNAPPPICANLMRKPDGAWNCGKLQFE